VSLGHLVSSELCPYTTTTTTILWPFVWDYPHEPVPEETFTHTYPDHQPSFINFTGQYIRQPHMRQCFCVLVLMRVACMSFAWCCVTMNCTGNCQNCHLWWQSVSCSVANIVMEISNQHRIVKYVCRTWFLARLTLHSWESTFTVTRPRDLPLSPTTLHNMFMLARMWINSAERNNSPDRPHRVLLERMHSHLK